MRLKERKKDEMLTLNSKTKKSVPALLILICFVFVFIFQADIANGDAGYTVKNYKVDMNVRENASAYINEEIDVDFDGYHHGIYRWIPLTLKLDLNDGTNKNTLYSSIKIDDISVASDMFETENKIESKVIKIGDPSKTITGKKRYKLSYTIKQYEDQIKGYDLFYCNLIPFHNEATVENAEITVVMPKKFDRDRIRLVVGKSGDLTSDAKYGKDVKYEVKGNTVIVKSTAKLPPGTGITMALTLPEGYFQGAMSHTLYFVILYILFALIAAASIFMWFKYGRDRKIVQTVEFEPPENISPAELGYIIDGNADKKDVISLLFYFAQQGYLEIRQEDKHDFTLIKKSDLSPGAKAYERTFFDGLFENREEVKISELEGEFYDTYDLTKTLIEKEFSSKSKKIFPGSVSFARMAVFALGILGFAAIGIFMYFSIRRTMLIFKMAIAVITIFAGLFTGVMAQDNYYSYDKKKIIIYNAVSLGTTIFSATLMFFTVREYFNNITLAILSIIMMGCLYFSARFMQSRTKFGAEIFGKILGFKEFIKIAEKDRIEKIIETNPEYFYDILPYAYVMGLSKKWCKKFEGIAIEPPTWWTGAGDYGRFNMFDAMIMYSMLNNCSTSFDNTFNIPASDGGAFSDGGGFSAGGGFGGGGMGSW